MLYEITPRINNLAKPRAAIVADNRPSAQPEANKCVKITPRLIELSKPRNNPLEELKPIKHGQVTTAALRATGLSRAISNIYFN